MPLKFSASLSMKIVHRHSFFCQVSQQYVSSLLFSYLLLMPSQNNQYLLAYLKKIIVLSIFPQIMNYLHCTEEHWRDLSRKMHISLWILSCWQCNINNELVILVCLVKSEGQSLFKICKTPRRISLGVLENGSLPAEICKFMHSRYSLSNRFYLFTTIVKLSYDLD